MILWLMSDNSKCLCLMYFTVNCSIHTLYYKLCYVISLLCSLLDWQFVCSTCTNCIVQMSFWRWTQMALKVFGWESCIGVARKLSWGHFWGQKGRNSRPRVAGRFMGRGLAAPPHQLEGLLSAISSPSRFRGRVPTPTTSAKFRSNRCRVSFWRENLQYLWKSGKIGPRLL